MNRQTETENEIDYVCKNYMCLTQEFIILKEIAKSIAVLADNIAKPVKPFHAVNNNNFINDWTAGNDAAKEDISDFAHDHIKKWNGKLQDDWDSGYIAAMMDIIEFIERMGTDERD